MIHSELNTNSPSNSEDDIDLKEIFSALWKKRVLMVVVVGMFAIGSVIYSLSLPNLYTSESVLMTAGSDDGSFGGVSQQLGGLVKATTGINLMSSAAMSKGSMAILTINSRDFLKHLLTFDSVLKNLGAIYKFDKASQSSVFDSSIYDENTDTWLSGKPSHLEVYEDYREMVKSDYNLGSGLVKLRVEHVSPVFAYEFLSLIIQEVNALSRERDLIESKKALDYLYEQLSSTQVTDIQQSISQLIASQLNTQMLANIKPDYILQPFDKPFIPMEKSNPGRLIICVLGVILGLILSSAGVLISHFVREDR